MMIDAVMYGMMPRANRANWVSAPPENRVRKPSTPAPSSAWVFRFWTASRSMPGAGTADPARYTARMKITNRIFLRRSDTDATRARLFRLWNTCSPGGGDSADRVDQRLVNWLPLAGGRRSPHGRARVPTVPPAAVMASTRADERGVG